MSVNNAEEILAKPLLLLLKSFFIALGLLATQIACAAQNIPSSSPACSKQDQTGILTSPLLSVVTLNMAHGRKDAFNQMFQKTSTTRANLQEISNFLSDSGADLVALQEADGPSRWSGKFDHVEFVSENSAYPCNIHARHAKKYMYDFGTALLSSVPFTNELEYTFEPSPPTTNKGFSMGQVRWNPDGRLPEPVTVSVISVHLDFSRKKVRDAQVAEMRAVLADVEPPVIIMGDFNTDLTKERSALKAIVEGGLFKVYKPESTLLGTYKSGTHRLDWILISNDLDFVTYEVPQAILSDHQPVQATLSLVGKPNELLDSKLSE